MARKGILLINLGTPASYEVKDVRHFLRVFLSDPYVIDLPAVLRYIILYAFILPFRPRKSAAAYESIWLKQGSPLLVYSNQLRDQLALQLGNDYLVALGMRYSKPSIEQALHTLTQEDCSSIIVLPLFPQYSAATTESAINQVKKTLKKYSSSANIHYIKDFYRQQSYTGAYAHLINQTLRDNPQIEDILLSFHGLPVRQIIKSEKNGKACEQKKPCPVINENNKLCYRAQCYASARIISSALHFKKNNIQVCFQSRLGKNPWIGPALEESLQQIRDKGIKNIAVACPSFVTDCIETLEEIGIRAKETWQQIGGDSLVLVPCLNSDPLWVNGLADWLTSLDLDK